MSLCWKCPGCCHIGLSFCNIVLKNICTFRALFTISEAPDAYYYRTAMVGQTVKFPCRTKLQEDVDWARLDSLDARETKIYVGDLGPRELGLDPRFTMLNKSQSHTMVIYNVTVDDSATYRCVEDSGLGNRRFYVLTVKGKPFIRMSV